jgi:quinoprotein dehydrogenase-associated probable ABC transporter substrate-binding protein
MSRPRRRIAGIAVLALGIGAAHAGPPELLERSKLRVCADGNNLPFSNQAGEGLENEIAEMMAEELGLPLHYVWAPQIMGFVRHTLDLRVCDVMIGVAAGYELVQNTNPYYRSVYAFVLPADSDLAPDGLSDPALRGRAIGVVSDTPPMVPLRSAGAKVRGYLLHVDTRVISPVREAIDDVASGALDGAVLWGPIAGYYAAQQDPPLKVVALVGDDSGARLDFRITMGIRHNEPQWKNWINDFIARRQDAINRVLAEYHVPLLDRRGDLIDVAELRDGG